MGLQILPTRLSVSVGIDARHEARFIIDGEPTDLDMTSGAKGILALKLTAKGIAGHSAYPERGFSAAHARNDVFHGQ